jgi:tRNA threonylcarbamoyl adenosine modification protein YjeE
MILRGPDDTAALGAQIAARLAKGDAVALEGDLGAGKTTLARAVLHALGHEGDVPSPTFTLAQRYETARLIICHYDLYRIGRESEVDELALDDALDEGAVLIEWPERAGARLPGDALHVQLDIIDAEARRARLSGPARWVGLSPEGYQP